MPEPIYNNTKLNTAYTNQLIGDVRVEATIDQVMAWNEAWENCRSTRERDGMLLTEAREDDRLLAELSGALLSEVWG